MQAGQVTPRWTSHLEHLILYSHIRRQKTPQGLRYIQNQQAKRAVQGLLLLFQPLLLFPPHCVSCLLGLRLSLFSLLSLDFLRPLLLLTFNLAPADRVQQRRLY